MSFLSPLGRIFQLDKKIKISRPSVDTWQDAIYKPHDDHLPDRYIYRWQRQYAFFAALVIVTILLILGRLIYIQIVLGDFYSTRSDNNHLRIFDERALRGVILDRNGENIVSNIAANSLTIVPADFPNDPEHAEALAAELSQIVDLQTEEILERINNFRFHYRPVVIKKDISHQATIELLGKYQGRYGIKVKKDFKRYYQDSEAFAHINGYMAEVTEKDLEDFEGLYKSGDFIGKTGLESNYEGVLKGKDRQKKIIINSAGERISDSKFTPPIPGANLVLTLDYDLQIAAYNALKKGLWRSGSEAGVVIAMNPNNGEILAMVNLPSYDSNIFTDGIKGEEAKMYQQIIEDKNKPFLNRAISGNYPPGSVYKLVTASAALQKGVVEPETKLYAPGFIVLAHDYEENIEFLYPDWKDEGHGFVNIRQALASSADTYFYQVAGGYENQEGVGIEYLSKISERFGLGKILGINLPGEIPGVMPDPEWKYYQKNEQWYQGDTFHVGIGQGYLLVTPLQVASFTSTVANGGVVLKPHIVKEIHTADGGIKNIEPEVLDSHFINPSYIDEVKRGMRLAVTSDNGTAKALRGYPYQIAGKTGTAQYHNNEREHAWFTAFAPFQYPEIIVSVLVEGGGEGSVSALPVAAELITSYFQLQQSL